MKVTIIEPDQVSFSCEKVSETECRAIALPPEHITPDPVAALNFAREHGLEEGSSEAWLVELREGDRA